MACIIGQKCVVLTVFTLLGALSFTLFASHFISEARFESLRVGGVPYPGSKNENFFHFVQISDVHISVHDGLKRTDDFKKLCSSTINMISPEAVIITGDLTDAKSENKLQSVQYQDEWITFKNATSHINTKVISIRGNHDSSNEMYYINSLYHKFIENDIRTNMFTIEKPFGNYSFLAVDAAPEPGFKRPFNFVGYVSDYSINELNLFNEVSKLHNQTLTYGHYPTSTLYNANYMRDLFASISIAYLCGHLHDGGGMISKMQHMHRNGVAELELADWKKNRYFRVLSFDHDIFSFTDYQWTADMVVVHITNPPQWQLTNPAKQPVDRIAKSTHVRALVFSSKNLTKVLAEIDGNVVQMDYAGDNLWTVSWTPREGTEGSVKVTAYNMENKNGSSLHYYKTNYTTINSSKMSPAGTFILSVDFCVYFTVAFWLGLSIPLFFMFTMSKFYSSISGRQSLQLKWNFLLRFQILFGYEPYSTYLSLPLSLYCIWMMFFPWFIGNVIDSPDGSPQYGIISTFGVYYAGNFHMAHEIFASGFWDVVTFLWPTLLYCSYFSERRWSSNNVWPTTSFNLIFFMLMIFSLLLRLLAIYSIFSSHGWSAIFSPVFLFPPLFILYSSYFIYFKSSVEQ